MNKKCGKSTLLFELYKNYLLKNNIAENQMIEIDLDDIENSQYRDSFKKMIIVRDHIVPRYDEYGIYYVGIRDFLLRDDILEAR